jgi:DNA repair protein RecN (Recombination protein N)
MLKRLFIKDFTLIRELTIDFSAGFSVISGETGSGKSIMFDALGLLLGNRADSSVVAQKASKSIVEANFASNQSANDCLVDMGFEPEAEIIIRREIYQTGKSRNFINDAVANLQQIKNLGECLADIHAQHQTLLLNRKDYQLNLLDTFCGLNPLKNEYRTAYQALKALQLSLIEKQELLEKSRLEIEFVQFQLEIFEKLKLQEGQLTALEQEVQTLENAASIKSDLLLVNEGIEGEDGSAVQTINKIIGVLKRLSSYFEPAKELLNRVETVKIELQDIAAEAFSTQEKTILSEEKLIQTKSRLDEIFGFMQKHRVNTEEELFGFVQSLQNKSQDISALEDLVEKLEKQTGASRKTVFELAKKLSEKRNTGLTDFCKSIENLLVNLQMEKATVTGKFLVSGEPGPSGFENFQIELSTAKGLEPKPIDKVASGGELSRIMLSLKILLADLGGIPTLIFDEIETGVSGKVADKMGKMLLSLSKKCQVISITHLPQIAALGKQHFKAFKVEDAEGTYSQLSQLTAEEKLNEIASMLSAEKITPQALENAKTLMQGSR